MFGNKLYTHGRKIILCPLGGLLAATALANDGKGLTVAAKSTVPVHYYQWLMVAIGVGYGMYLLVRAKSRDRRRQKNQSADNQ